jgi:hypothetical protein
MFSFSSEISFVDWPLATFACTVVWLILMHLMYLSFIKLLLFYLSIIYFWVLKVFQ